MTLVAPSDGGKEPNEPFPYTWLMTDPVQDIIHASPLGVGLLQAVCEPAPDVSGYDATGQQITDFQYIMINQVLQVLLKLPAEDVLNQFLSLINPAMRSTESWGRLIQVMHTSQPTQFTDVYPFDGMPDHYHQLYLKSGDGILVLVQDITYSPLSAPEQCTYGLLLGAMESQAPTHQLRSLLLALISGQTYQGL